MPRLRNAPCPTAHRALSLAALAATQLVVGTARAAAPLDDLPAREKREPAPPSPKPFLGLAGTRGYVHLAPGIVALPTAEPRRPFYMWGLGAGRFWSLGRAFAASAGGFFEHLTRRDREEEDPFFTTDTRRSSVRFGAEVRLGGAARRVFGYGLLRAGGDVVLWKEITDSNGAPGPSMPFMQKRVDGGFLASLGAGVQALAGRHVLFGFEPSVDLSLVAGEAIGFLRLRAFLGVAF